MMNTMTNDNKVSIKNKKNVLLQIKDVMEMYGVTRKFVQKMVHDGCPCFKVGNRYLFKADLIDEYFEGAMRCRQGITRKVEKEHKGRKDFFQ